MHLLDIAQITETERLDNIINAFNALGPKEEFIISSNSALIALLSDFQKQFWGKFDWLPLVAGPTLWKGKIIKRDATKVVPETIHHFMEGEHARCDQLYADGEAALLDNNIELGKELLVSFDLCMRRHFVMEEQIFFPAFEERTGMTQGPTQVMRMEHEQMRKVLTQMKNALDANDTETVLGAGETMLILLQQHNMKEENMLYPMGDGQIADIAEELLKKMQLIEL